MAGIHHMRFYADLHVHSKYSRATSNDCDLPHLAYWARRKGIAVVGTGDFTHPGWMAELSESLVPAEPGLFRLRDDLERAVSDRLEGPCQGATRFLLSVEISTIYKKGDRTRKIHHLVYMPDFAAAGRLVRALARIGNLSADGRPILGLDARHLLEAVLESGEGAYLVPAHIWTPWFSVLGSKAGFDAVEACYGDLAPHVFALETGLSSDPAMNWRVSALDRYRLVSSSDAHSPGKLGREATAFDVPLDYFAIRRALETGDGFRGTVEFFPEEGKYHLDGHRKCNVVLDPAETRARKGACPVCKQPVTVGVLHRVEELADRAEGARPASAGDFRNLVPLPEVLAELCGTGPSSKTVQQGYQALLSRVGPELFLLDEAPLDTLERAGPPLLAEAIERMRAGRVIRTAGYDGEYGTIRLFTPDELRRRRTASFSLFADFDPPPAAPAPAPAPASAPASALASASAPAPASASAPAAASASAPASALLAALDPDQRAAAEITDGPLLVVAGPGTGKTRTLTHRIAHLVADRGVAPERCLAITFTRRAADELRDRLRALLGDAGDRVPAMTFHALGLSLLREHAPDGDGARSIAGERERIALLARALGAPEARAKRLLAEISRLKRACARHAGAREALGDALPPGGELDRAWSLYEQALDARGLLDFDDLVGRAVDLLERDAAARSAAQEQYQLLSIDEYQDIDERQYRLVHLLASPFADVCAIGDPDQAIYSFRGADVGFFFRFCDDFRHARTVRLTRNYRSTRTIVDAALQVIAPSPTLGERDLRPLREGPSRITILSAATERAEAELVVHTIERMVGGAAFFSMDSGRVGASDGAGDHGFADFAILYRTDAQAEPLREALARSGFPYQRRSHRRVAARAAVEALTRALAAAQEPAGPLAERLKRAAASLREEVARATPAEGADDEAEAQDEAALGEADVDAALELLLPIAARAAERLDRFLLEVALEIEADTWDPRADRISLLTLHAAKGLEFRTVFVVGCEDGLLPLRFAHADEAAIQEERRLFYVGMTRAREQLFLTHARERTRYGRPAHAEVSPFVREIEERLLERRSADPPQRAPRPGERQLGLF